MPKAIDKNEVIVEVGLGSLGSFTLTSKELNEGLFFQKLLGCFSNKERGDNMSFVRFERSRKIRRRVSRDRDTEPFLTLSKGFKKLYFNWIAMRDIVIPRGYYVEFYFDEKTDQIGLQFSEFYHEYNRKISPSGKDANGGSVGCQEFLEEFNIDRIFKKVEGFRFPIQGGDTFEDFFYVQLER